MQFFEISYIPKGSKAFELVGDILSDKSLVKEMNETADEGQVFLTNIQVRKEKVAGEKPTIRYATSVESQDRSTPEGLRKSSDLDIKVIKGAKHDCIIVSGEEEHKPVANLLLGHIRTKILPNVSALENVIIVKSP